MSLKYPKRQESRLLASGTIKGESNIENRVEGYFRNSPYDQKIRPYGAMRNRQNYPVPHQEQDSD